VRAATNLREPVDAVLVTVKATQLGDAVARVPREALGDAIVVPFLNGFEHVERLRSVYPERAVVPATIRIETARVRTGLIRHTSPFATLELAKAGGDPRVERLAEHLRATGIEVRLVEDERTMLWDKFAVLEPMAMITTSARANIGYARTHRRDDLVGLVGEVAAVATADGAAKHPDQLLAFIDSLPETMESSMQRDDAAEQPLEVDALGGALIRRAEMHGVDVPVTRRITAELAARR
jgi:2-dehydropantoate 2-reductase